MKILAKIKRIMTPLIFTILGIFLYLEARKIRTLKFGGALGGDFFPKVLSLILIFLSVIWTLKELIKSIRQKSVSEKIDIVGGFKQVRRVILFAVIFVLYILSLKLLGFITATFFLMFFNHLLLREEVNLKSIPITVAYALIVSIGVWYLFEKVFDMTLPSGIF